MTFNHNEAGAMLEVTCCQREESFPPSKQPPAVFTGLRRLQNPLHEPSSNLREVSGLK
jgi:hypothetical protein